MKSSFVIGALGAFACLVASPASAVTHSSCEIHGSRTYLHRHVDPSDRVISCDRPVQLGRYPTTARCSAQALRNAGSGPEIPGTLMAVEIPYRPSAPASERADSMNFACAEAIEACYHVAGDVNDVYCAIVDQGFVR